MKSFFPFLIAISLLAACSSPSQEEQSSEPNYQNPLPQSAEGYLFARDGLKLYYQVLGEGKEVLVLPLGMELVDDLAELAQGRKIISFHNRGRGLSGLPSSPSQAGLDWEVEDIEAIRKAFQLEKISLLGFSFSAAAVFRYAYLYPNKVESFILLSPLPPRSSPYMAARQATFNSRIDSSDVYLFHQLKNQGLAQKDPVSFCEQVRELNFKAVMYEPSNYKLVKSKICQYPNENSQNLSLQLNYLMASLGNWDWRTLLPETSPPGLILHGAHDAYPVEGVQEWARLLENGKLTVFQQSGHFPFLEEPALFFKTCDDFLTENKQAE